MKIAIVGSRDYPDIAAVRAYVALLPANTIIVSGGARGVDSIAENAARERGMECLIFKPDWDRDGKSAAFVRNATIAEECDEMVAFWDGKSRGTKSAIQYARDLRKTVTVYHPTPLSTGE